LPSFHPYWRNKVKKDIRKSIKQTVVKYNECKKNPEKIKYHFNSYTSLGDIEKIIKEYKLKLK